MYGDSCYFMLLFMKVNFLSRLFKSTALELTNWRIINLEKRLIHRRAYFKIKSQFEDMEQGICSSRDLQWQLGVFCLEVIVYFLWEATDAIFAKIMFWATIAVLHQLQITKKVVWQTPHINENLYNSINNSNFTLLSL